jgi:type IV pilus assembly protein PilP
MVRRATSTLLLALMLSGCGSDGVTDLRQFTENTHKNKKPRVDPIPEVKVYEKFAYTAYKLPDPFSSSNLSRATASANASDTASGGLGPDLTRTKEALEQYPLDALTMVGTLQKGKDIWAIISVRSAGGEVHRVKVGNHMGRNYGMITEISEDRIALVELVRSSLGDWVEREATIKLKE